VREKGQGLQYPAGIPDSFMSTVHRETGLFCAQPARPQRFPGTEETRLWRPNAIRLRQSVEVLWVCSYISAGAAGGRIR
jgi:hypothetical protein